MTGSFRLNGLHHVARVTKHLEASRAFYREVLGFAEIPRPNFSFGGAWLFNYGLQIHLIVDEQARNAEGPIQTRGNHLAFETPDIEAFETGLKERGIEYRVNYQAGTGVKQLFFRDPDGHHVEIGSYGPTRTE
jgi:catechol 2,3-dioxygenase-like lactoylglutathione lyase family enzyme